MIQLRGMIRRWRLLAWFERLCVGCLLLRGPAWFRWERGHYWLGTETICEVRLGPWELHIRLTNYSGGPRLPDGSWRFSREPHV